MSRLDPSKTFSTGSKQAEQTLFALILIHLRDAIVVTDMHGQIEWINPAAERLFGWTLEEVKGRRPHEFVLPTDARPSAEMIKGFRYDPERSVFHRLNVSEHLRRDGSLFWNQHSFTMIETGTRPRDRKVVITCRDISQQVTAETEARQMRDRLKHAAHHDDLTGLANRKALAEHLSSHMIRKRIAKGEVGILQLDLDLFKEINDTLGHAAGDAALGHVADAMRAGAGPADLCCRTGGDEFVQICSGIRRKETLMARAEALRAAIAKPMIWAGQSIRLDTSVGVSLPTCPETTGETLIQMADQALYAAKNRGRGRVVFYTDRLGRAQTAEARLATELKDAVRERQLHMHLQPQLDLRNNRIIACEALLRWDHPERGLLLPADFLRTAETHGLLAELDYLSLTLALDALSDLRQAGFTDLKLTLNLSKMALAEPNYPALLNWALQSRDIPAADICIELLETSLIDRRGPDVRGAVEALKSMGVRIALDDFGAGYAGLSHMTSLNVDAIKLDSTLTARLEQDARTQAVVLAVLQLAKDLRMDVVAEGVETEAQFEFLKRSDCHFMQGFLLAYPMRTEDMIGWMRAETDASRRLVRAFLQVHGSGGASAVL